jgi:PIN domain nuclease of toxin-antitoxin system
MTVRLLLDTHVFLWLMRGDVRLRTKARTLIAEAEQVYVSAATIWEIAIKARLGKLEADVDKAIAEIRSNGFEELPVYARHARLVAGLPKHHGDPFDRLLVAQAQADTLRLLTADPHIMRYSELVIQA